MDDLQQREAAGTPENPLYALFMEHVDRVGLPEALADLDRYAIGTALREEGGNATEAARRLRMLRTTLSTRALKHLNHRRKVYRQEPEASAPPRGEGITARYHELLAQKGDLHEPKA